MLQMVRVKNARRREELERTREEGAKGDMTDLVRKCAATLIKHFESKNLNIMNEADLRDTLIYNDVNSLTQSIA